jgi:arylsulfatase A-like enzyme
MLPPLLMAVAALAISAPDTPAKPNVLMIAIDDLNDWVGCLGGHPLAKTPHIDALARRGTLFSNAHCQSPLCNPSRTSLLLSLRPTTTGIYGLAPFFRQVPAWSQRVTLPQHFAQNGYRTLIGGKVFHGGYARNDEKEAAVWGPATGIGVKPAKKLIPPTPEGNHPLMDWGVFPHDDADKGDTKIADWAVEMLKSPPKDLPFFLAAGFFLPHVPCYVTQKWYDLYPDDDTVLPPLKADDRDDTPRFSWYLHWRLPEPRWSWVTKHNQARNLARSYLASISYVDHQVGRIIAALDASGQADNTVIVLWSDHGWHLGEKAITGKNTLWERSARVPLIFAGPGVTAGGRCTRPAELLDVYPTLSDLCGLPPRDDLEGHSLIAQLRNGTAPREWPAITSHNQGNHTVRSERWRYIHYADSSEELYDLQADPNEWSNLAADPRHAAVKAEHRRWLPKIDRPPVPKSAHRILTYDPATRATVWEGQPIQPNDPIPE